MSELRWPRIQEILNKSLKRWQQGKRSRAQMRGAHQGPVGWQTKEELASSAPYEKQLIEQDKVGNGRASETHLIRILRGP